MAGEAGLVGEEPVPELGVVAMSVEHGVGEMGVVEFCVGDRCGEPAVVLLPDVTPGLVPLSIESLLIQFDNVIGWIPKSLAICSRVTPASRLRATRITSSRNSRG